MKQTPPELEKAHKEILEGLEKFLGYEPTKRQILPLPTSIQNPLTLEEKKTKSLGEYHYDNQVIKLRQELYPFDKESTIESDNAYINAKNLFKDKPITFDKRLCFIVVGTHEYAHSEFDEKYEDELGDIIKSYSTIQKGKIPFISSIIQKYKINKDTDNILSGISEAYSFWVTDMIFDIKSITPNRIQHYKEKYGEKTANTMDYFYPKLHNISKKAGSQFVNKNLNEIVKAEYELHSENPLALKK